MYVNTLITLQENLTTYAVEGKKVSGHVTMNSPGMIKCYIQNLRGQEIGHKYAFYAFSKTHNKAVRIGELGKNKETHWVVSEKNVEGSGIKLEDLDAVAIVAENSMRGADTVAMGFKNSRYMIIPLIDEVVKKMPSMKSKAADNNYKTPVQPDYVQKGKSPIKAQELKSGGNSNTANTNSKDSSQMPTDQGEIMSIYNQPITPNENTNGSGNNIATGYYGNQTGNANQTQNASTMNGTLMPTDQGEIMSIYNQPITPNEDTNGSGNNNNTVGYYGNQTGNANQTQNASTMNGMSMPANQGGSMNILGGATNQNGNMNNVNGQMNQGQISQSQMNQNGSQVMADDDLEFVTEEEMQIAQSSSNMAKMNGQNNDNTVPGMSEGLEEIVFVKSPIITGNEFEDSMADEDLEDEEAELTKITEKLKNAEKQPVTYSSIKSSTSLASSGISNNSVGRDESKTIDEALEKTSQELRSIIERLSSNGEVRDKIESLKNEIEKISELSRTYKEDEKPHLEKTLEERYIGRQKAEQEDEQDDREKEISLEVEQEEIDENVTEKTNLFETVPREAVTFIKHCIEKIMPQENGTQNCKKEAIVDEKRSIKEEVDYISEIDRRIQEIEERRKREREK